MPVNSFEDYPMSWKPVLDRNSRPIYLFLANALEGDIRAGRLTPGTKLPPQRELADYLDINLSTVTRAFKLCEQHGLICSAVGSGTYVSSDAAANSLLMLNNPDERVIELGAILPSSKINRLAADYLKEMAAEPDFYKLLQYSSIEPDDLQIKAAQRWLGYSSLASKRGNILFSAGSQNAIFAVLAALFKPGDRIATMPVTYPGLKVAAKLLGIQLVPLAAEPEKITREALQYALKNHSIKALYMIPDFNNPTSEVMDIKTRRMIADFCTEADIPVIEDGIYTLFMPSPLPSITSLAPQHGIFIASTSKALAPGLRIAVLHIPERFHSGVRESLYATQITPPTLMTQLFTRVVISGLFDKMRALRIEEIARRNAVFDEVLSGFDTRGDIHSPIRWLLLPERFSPAQFEALALSKRVQLYAADRFTVGTTAVPNAVRISLISAQPEKTFIKGLKTVRALLEEQE